jgi:hypothetical protein
VAPRRATAINVRGEGESIRCFVRGGRFERTIAKLATFLVVQRGEDRCERAGEGARVVPPLVCRGGMRRHRGLFDRARLTASTKTWAGTILDVCLD